MSDMEVDRSEAFGYAEESLYILGGKISLIQNCILKILICSHLCSQSSYLQA